MKGKNNSNCSLEREERKKYEDACRSGERDKQQGNSNNTERRAFSQKWEGLGLKNQTGQHARKMVKKVKKTS